MTKEIVQFKNELELKKILNEQYFKQVENLFADHERALEFMTNAVALVQRNEELANCAPDTFFNSLMTMASLRLMPSGVSGEAFILPYKGAAQFQLGYKGLVTLLYRAGNKSIVAELVRATDSLKIRNGKIEHEVDATKSNAKRGKVIGAYAIITTASGETVEQFMHIDDITAHAKKFSKSYGTKFSPWDPENDPNGWMPRKTVLIQTTKLAPKNPELNKALAEDNKDSVFSDRDPVKALPSAEDFTEEENLLKSCKTVEGLDFNWADMPGDAKLKLKGLYDECRAKLTKEESKDVI